MMTMVLYVTLLVTVMVGLVAMVVSGMMDDARSAKMRKAEEEFNKYYKVHYEVDPKTLALIRVIEKR